MAIGARTWLMGAAGTTFVAALATTAVLSLCSGCSTAGYLAQAAGGHLDLLGRAQPAAQVVADPATPAALRDRLQLSQRLRQFAVSELKLPDNASYKRYADLQREAAVWNVVAAPELSLVLKTWCFPVTGCIGYRGYFKRDAADAVAAELRGQSLEVNVYGVPAYSTLGWTNWLGGDPLLNTFINWPEAELARLIFHELAHQVAYASDDTTFNESFAVAVERIGGSRWLALHGTAAERERAAAADLRREDFRALTLRYRLALEGVFTSTIDDAAKRQRKAELMAEMRSDHQAMKTTRWGGFAGYDNWFAHANNASLSVLAAYNELVPQFEALLRRCDGDMPRFYAQVQGLAALPKSERRAKLAAPP